MSLKLFGVSVIADELVCASSMSMPPTMCPISLAMKMASDRLLSAAATRTGEPWPIMGINSLGSPWLWDMRGRAAERISGVER